MVAISKYKPEGFAKIELFYFLAVAWLDRSFANQKDKDKLRRWWGRDDWQQLKKLNALGRALAFVDRLKEL